MKNNTRCAIYTRKSTEEGLDQEFNSLDAQREACAAYIESQKQEGWVLLPALYDDGGISGGTLERPSLQRLMKDVDEGLVDQIVVYKIDRLTRSLSDFARLVDRLDAARASFVSVTQSFNTSTSMGRLTLNVLLSFAQFEREVTAERIRDKIAASKQKGMWMGGAIPLGYEPDGRTLKIIDREAQTVRTLFDLYLEHKTLRHVADKATGLGLRSKPRRNRQTGVISAGKLGPSHIHHILSNPLYTGMIRHKDKIYEGQHPAIVDDQVFEAVQKLMKEQSSKTRGKPNQLSNVSCLQGKLFDETGDHLTPTHANKKSRRYRYYISNRLLRSARDKKTGTSKGGDIDNDHAQSQLKDGWRLPAEALEKQIASAVLTKLETLLHSKWAASLDVAVISKASDAIGKLQTNRNVTQTVQSLAECIERVDITKGSMVIKLSEPELRHLAGLDEFKEKMTEGLSTQTENEPNLITFEVPFQHRKRGQETKLVIGNQIETTIDTILLTNIAKAQAWYKALKAGASFEHIATTNNLSKRRVLQIMDLAFLSPDLVKQISQGKQPLGLTTERLSRYPMPASWKRQKAIAKSLA